MTNAREKPTCEAFVGVRKLGNQGGNIITEGRDREVKNSNDEYSFYEKNWIGSNQHENEFNNHHSIFCFTKRKKPSIILHFKYN